MTPNAQISICLVIGGMSEEPEVEGTGVFEEMDGEGGSSKDIFGILHSSGAKNAGLPAVLLKPISLLRSDGAAK